MESQQKDCKLEAPIKFDASHLLKMLMFHSSVKEFGHFWAIDITVMAIYKFYLVVSMGLYIL